MGYAKVISSLAGKHLGTTMAVAGYALTAIPSYRSDRARGVNPVMAGARALGEAVLWNEFMLPMVGLSVAPMMGMINQQYSNTIGNLQKNIMPFSPYTTDISDSTTAQTSRGRAVEAIQNSRMNARQYVGAEAGLFASRYR
jgi:hypothetical protein